MNWLGLATVLLAFPAFAFGCWSAGRRLPAFWSWVVWGVAIFFAVPGIIYCVYYTRLLGEPIWFYQVRTVPGTELLASPAGFLAGWFQVRVVPRLQLSQWGTRFLVPVLLGFSVALPYLKPILKKPQPVPAFRDQWTNGVCLQSTFSTCGPASAATALNQLGIKVSEQELARAAYTSASGTENWYLARALRRHGMQTAFLFSKTLDTPLPAVIGVRLKNSANSGHFIALLDKQGSKFILGDPMEGRLTSTLAELADEYEFTGFILSLRKQSHPAYDH